MIVDCHMHIFTCLDGPGGYDSPETHRDDLKGSHSNVVRRQRDGAVITRPVDWARAENFRAAQFGRYEWTLDGEDYYVQQFSPSLQQMESSPEFVIAQMDYVGIDVAVLQHDTIYGRFNDLFAEAMRRYPGRFIGLAKLDEATAYTDEQRRLLRHYAQDRGLRGVFFQQSGFAQRDDVEWAAPGRFTPFWETVRDLGLAVYLHQTRDYWAMAGLAQRYPEITFITHLPEGRLPREGHIHVQDSVVELMSLPNTLFEICPIAYGFRYEYPYTEMHAAIRPLYEAFGGGKFCWGSDMPNLERFCTYLQGLDFLRRHCGFIAREDMPLILGGNMARVFKLEGA